MPRSLALDVVEVVLLKNAALDETFERHPRLKGMEVRDRGFARLLATTTLRRLGQIDEILGRCLTSPLPRKAHTVKSILRIGAAQLLFLDTPAHAAVDTAVELVRERELHGFAKLINAILRRLTREGAKMLATQDSERLMVQDWLWNSWVDAYGEDRARAIARAHMNEACLDISVKDPARRDHWAQELGASILPNGSLRLEKAGRVDLLSGYDQGEWWVQDAAASLPATLLGDVKGKVVFDLCAAPGGKTLQLAAAGAQVIAVDRSENRLERLKQNLERTGLQADVICADLTEWHPDQLADAILLDPPCSATGTLRRHPEGLWLKSEADIDRLARLQATLLQRLPKMLKPDGVAVYCTCSLDPREGENIIEGQTGLSAVDLTDFATSNDLQGAIVKNGLRITSELWPQYGNLDGFFMAKLINKAG